MDPGTSFSSFQDEAFADLVDTTKTSARLAAEDLPFHRSFDRKLASSLDKCNATILGLVNSLLRNATAGTDLDAPKLDNTDDIETHWKDVVEVVDYLLEKADTCLDEYTGAIKQKNPQLPPGARRDDIRKTAKPASLNMFRNRNLVKPQLSFRTQVNNNNNSPFKPLLTTKPHAKIPLKDSLRSFVDEKLQTQYYHPYKSEIEELEYPPEVFASKSAIEYKPLHETKASYIDTKNGLADMLQDLRNAKEIAIDLEHHSDRSYIGFVCLMQISTREKDWIVDTLKLREELQILNEIFADPKILKVLHGAYMDIIWLQRDFGLYIVGLFDTYEAARSLGFASKGLAFLLKKYVDFDAEKQYQLADWRIRPLPQEMLDYARSDTHFLLYCYDMVRNELLSRSTPDTDLMKEVLANSKETSLRRYEREAYDLEEGSGQFGWVLMLKRTPANFTSEQFAVFKAIHHWRDKIARDEDDSHHFVLPKHQLYNLARSMPEDIPGVLGACHPASPHVRLRVSELVATIKAAKEKVAAEAPEVPAIAALPEAPSESLVAVRTPIPEGEVPKAEPSIDIFATISLPTRAQESSFWGSTVGSSKWLSGFCRASADVRLAVPLPPLTAAIYVNPDDPRSLTTPSLPPEPGSRVEHEFVRKSTKPQGPANDGIIVIKQVGVGRKRKRDTSNAEPEEVEELETSVNQERDPAVVSEEEIVPSDAEDTLVAAQLGIGRESERQSKKARKKKAEKQAKGKVKSASKDATPFEPFDYTTAKSLLKGGEKEGQSSRAFNPYGNPSSRGPKTLNNRRKEKEGKTTTFKK